MEKIALLPGGFKPPHAGHYNMAKWLVANTDADSIVIRVGSKERGGITREMSLKLWDLYRESDPDSPPLAILASENNSPVADVYDFIEQDAPEGSKIYLGAGEKDKEDSRYNNINKFADPKNIDFEVVLVPPQAGGVSGTEMRSFINDGDKNNFQKYLPNHLTLGQKNEAWDIVTTKPEVEEDFYNPKNKTVDFMKSSEYKAGMPDGHKEDMPRFGDRIHNRQTSPVSWEENLKEQQGGRTLRVYDFDDTLAVTKGANIKVKHADGTIDTLDPSKFAVYQEQPGDKFDFTEFDSVIKEAEPIKHIVNMLKQDVEDPSVDKVTILTARLLAYPVKRYMREDLGLDVYVVAVGSSDPLDKATWIEDHILKGYNDIMFIDDSEPNRNAVKSLKDTHTDINLEVFHPNDLSEAMMGTMTKREKRKHKRKLKKIRKGLKKYNKKNRYFKVPKSWRKKTLTRKIRKEQFVPKSHSDPYNLKQYSNSAISINNRTLPVEIMRTPEEQTAGMMDRTEMKKGMIFPYDKVSRKDFHMENCLFSLDIIFIKDKTIDTIHDNCPPCKKMPCPKYSGLADNVLELPGGYCKQNNINVGDRIHLNLTENKIKENALTKEWWKNIINKMLLVEGGAAGHMAHPFNLPNVNSGKDLKDVFNKAADSLQNNPGSVKIDGVNSSIRLIDLDGEKQFVMDRGSKKELDIQGITKDDLEDRFGEGHGMIKIGGEVLDMFNEALPSLQSDLEKLGVWDNPNILFNMEYVSGKTNVQDYGSNFIAIHGLNQIESKEVEGKRGMLTKRVSSEISYNKDDLQSLLDNLAPIAKEKEFEVYGSVPTEMSKDPNFSSALSQNYTIVFNEEEKTQTLDAWLNELNDIPEEDFIFMNIDSTKKKVGAVSKQVYTALLDGGNIDELFEDENDKQKAIEGFTTYLATEKLGDEVLKVLDSPMGSVDNHEGVVIRDENIANVPFKITGKFILGGLTSDF